MSRLNNAKGCQWLGIQLKTLWLQTNRNLLCFDLLRLNKEYFNSDIVISVCLNPLRIWSSMVFWKTHCLKKAKNLVYFQRRVNLIPNSCLYTGLTTNSPTPCSGSSQIPGYTSWLMHLVTNWISLTWISRLPECLDIQILQDCLRFLVR